MNYFKFYGDDQIHIFDFISRFGEEAGIIDMDGERHIACLVHMLINTITLGYR